ncbi:MAG: hypothetical protein ACXABY_04780 [Candidatus Thorarchaeota archaeon]
METKVRHLWKDNVLKLMRAGNTLTQAANVSGVAGHILSQEINRDPVFSREVAQAKKLNHNRLAGW